MPSVEDTARLLAQEHLKEDEGTRAIYWAPSDEEVRLVEVSTSVADRGEVLPFRFTSDPPDVPYPSIVILLGPGDWTRVENDELELPASFNGNLQQLVAR